MQGFGSDGISSESFGLGSNLNKNAGYSNPFEESNQSNSQSFEGLGSSKQQNYIHEDGSGDDVFNQFAFGNQGQGSLVEQQNKSQKGFA